MTVYRQEPDSKSSYELRNRRSAPLHKALILTLFLGGCSTWNSEPSLRLEPGLIISKSVTIEPDTYFLAGDTLGAIQIRGDGITVDFDGAVLDGAHAGQDPDTFTGVGLLVSGSRGVTIKNVVIKGYKVAVMATDAPEFRLTGSDLSYNWRQRLKSTIERESRDDWMSYHRNENDEWLRFGAAVYLRRADRARIDHIKVTGGQNGIMASEVNDALFYNNSITFNSSVGIGLYRSSRNRIMHNRLDFNVRGHSPGIYNRGQDSAALLLYEQSSNNVIAFNSATHSGDGLFLWAGQSTMDTGEGGCNDNLIYSNDFSFAPTNGIEVTFSRNQIIDNRIEGCWHGVWGGYSYDTLIEGNEFVDNEEHIAVEHGQRLAIRNNWFSGGDVGLRVWERKTQPADWGYARNREVNSRDYDISENTFIGVNEPFRISNTIDVDLDRNSFSSRLEPQDSDPEHWSLENKFGTDVILNMSEPSVATPERLPDGQSVGLAANQLQGRNYMLIDEWGPYDFRSPVIWPRSRRSAREQTFEILGPPGEWQIVQSQGLEWISHTEGELTTLYPSDSFQVTLNKDAVTDISIDILFAGEDIIDRFGHKIDAGTPFNVLYNYFFIPVKWEVHFFEYNSETDPRDRYPAFRKLINGDPVYTDQPAELAYQWVRAPVPGLPADYFATVAEGLFNAPQGRYELVLTSDDGVRVWLDSNLIYEDWTYHAPRTELIPLKMGGNHTIRIEHFEIDGYATIMLSFRRIDE